MIGEFEKPWLDDSKKKPNWDRIIFYTCCSIAFGKQATNFIEPDPGNDSNYRCKAVSGYICWSAYAEVPKHDVCIKSSHYYFMSTISDS